MRINYQNNNIIAPNAFNKNNASKTNLSCSAPNNLKTDTISFSSNYSSILNKFETLGIKEYNSLNPKEVKNLRKILSDEQIEIRDSVIKLTKIVKNNLEQMSPDGYTFVSIGRSPDVIGKALEFQGADVKCCPISNLRFDFYADDLLSEPKYGPKLDLYKNYMDNIGLSSEKINNGKKKICFVDYTSSGSSLKNFQRLLESKKINLKSPNIKYLSLNNDLILKDKNNSRYISEIIDYCFESMRIKKYSEHKSICLERINFENEISAPTNSYFHKLMNFALIDEYKRLGVIKDDGEKIIPRKNLLQKIKDIFKTKND